MSSTLGIVQSRSRSWRDFEIFLHLLQYKLSSPIFQLWQVVIKYVCKSNNNIQDLLIPSRLNDLRTCCRHFHVDTMMLYISVRDHARKLKFSSYVHLPSINKMFHYCFAQVIL